MFKKLFLCVAVVAVPCVCVAGDNYDYTTNPTHLYGKWVRSRTTMHGHKAKEKFTINRTHINNLIDDGGQLRWRPAESGKIEIVNPKKGQEGEPATLTYTFEVLRKKREHKYSWVGDTVAFTGKDGITFKARRDYTSEEWEKMYKNNMASNPPSDYRTRHVYNVGGY